MPNQYAPDSTSLLLRLPVDLKERLTDVVDELNNKYPGANYSVSSVIRSAIERTIKEYEKELRK